MTLRIAYAWYRVAETSSDKESTIYDSNKYPLDVWADDGGPVPIWRRIADSDDVNAVTIDDQI